MSHILIVSNLCQSHTYFVKNICDSDTCICFSECVSISHISDEQDLCNLHILHSRSDTYKLGQTTCRSEQDDLRSCVAGSLWSVRKARARRGPSLMDHRLQLGLQFLEENPPSLQGAGVGHSLEMTVSWM